MPKLKTHKGTAKRFSLTGTGKVKRNHMLRRHFLSTKTTKRKRNLRKTGYADSANAATIKSMLPYA